MIYDYDAFISYTRRDDKFALLLYERLKRKGINCWLDKACIKEGEDWEESIGRALENSLAMILVLSKTSMTSENVKNELSYASKKQRAIIPVRIEDVQPTGSFGLTLSRLNWVDIFTAEKELLEERVNGIKDRILSLRTEKMKPLPEEKPQFSDIDQKYLNKVRKILDDDVISDSEKNSLSLLAETLGISQAHKKELEDFVKIERGMTTPTATVFEQKYVECLSKRIGEGKTIANAKEELDDLAESLDINLDRARELESIFLNNIERDNNESFMEISKAAGQSIIGNISEGVSTLWQKADKGIKGGLLYAWNKKGPKEK